MKYFQTSVLALIAASGLTYAQAPVSPATIINEPAPIGISATQSVLFSQPYCDGEAPYGTAVQRGIYTLTSTTPLVSLPASSSCAENYFAVSLGLGGFPSNQLYITGLYNGTPVIFTASASGGPVSVFSTLPVSDSTLPHAALTFDTVGTFGFNLIATGANGVQGYNALHQPTFYYPNPAPGTYLLEGATVAPLSYSPCPGCLFIVAENTNGTTSGIYVVHPGAPTGSTPQFFATGPQEAEGITFVQPNACTIGGNSYFVSAYNTTPVNTTPSTGGAILGYTPAQLSGFMGDFLVPNEQGGIIYAYSGPNAPGAAPNRTIFSNTGWQLEGSAMAVCPLQSSTTGFMTGGGQTANSAASHGFELGCSATSNHKTLEVNWGGNQFHLTSITSSTCYMDTAFGSPNPPAAGFNTLVMTGTGTYDGQSGATVQAIFTDAGEPGTNDQAMIVMTYNGTVVLNVPFATIATGNQQAHK